MIKFVFLFRFGTTNTFEMEQTQEIKGNKLIKFIKSPYLIITVLFGIWISFFDGNSYISQNKQKEQLKALQEQEGFYDREILLLGNNIRSIERDPEQLEKYARENYQYKKKGEQIFLVKEAEK